MPQTPETPIQFAARTGRIGPSQSRITRMPIVPRKKSVEPRIAAYYSPASNKLPEDVASSLALAGLSGDQGFIGLPVKTANEPILAHEDVHAALRGGVVERLPEKDLADLMKSAPELAQKGASAPLYAKLPLWRRVEEAVAYALAGGDQSFIKKFVKTVENAGNSTAAEQIRRLRQAQVYYGWPKQ